MGVGENNSMVIHLTLLPYLAASGELKTKPSQHSVRMLMESGIMADVLVCRSEHKIPKDVKSKLAQFCNVPFENVIESMDAGNHLSGSFRIAKQKFDEVVLKELALPTSQDSDLKIGKIFKKYKNPKKKSRNCFSREVCFLCKILTNLLPKPLYTQEQHKKPK